MRYVVTINNKSYEVEVEQGQANILRIEDAVAQVAVQAAASVQPVPAQQPVAAPVQLPAPVAPAPVSTATAAAVGGEQIKSPMPGTLLDVKVTSGQAVKKGDILFILEAMKMENEIMAPVDGVVQVVATKGASVSTGDVLASIQ